MGRSRLVSGVDEQSGREVSEYVSVVTVDELADVLADLRQHHPGAELERNDVGNLVFYTDERSGWIDLTQPAWEYF